MQITITGGTGFIGSNLIDFLLAKKHQVRLIGRSARTGVTREAQFFLWNTLKGEIPKESLENADSVVHLAGESVAQRWTSESRRKIRDSRVLGTRALVGALAGMERKPEVLVCASAIGIYGSRGDEVLNESANPSTGFLADVCKEWEAEADRASELGIRVVKLRTGVVLGVGGGALQQMLPPFRMFIGGKLGSGQQWMSWIHVDDMVGLICHALKNTGMKGVVNATSPNPVRNSQFTRVLARTIHRPAFFTVPEKALRLLFGDMAELLFSSQRVLPKAALDSGYKFQYPDLGPALKQLLG